jgi:hypothetical protein
MLFPLAGVRMPAKGNLAFLLASGEHLCSSAFIGV